MALNIKNAEVEKLATEAAELARESKTEAIRQALQERIRRLRMRRGSMSREDRMMLSLRASGMSSRMVISGGL